MYNKIDLREVPAERLKEINYTIPRNNRELQQLFQYFLTFLYYTIPRNNRELQLCHFNYLLAVNYTIPRNNRELQPVRLML